MRHIPNFARVLVASALLLGPAIASAQTLEQDRNRVATTEDRGGFDFGWLGLIGLAGLAGLKGREKDTAGYKATSPQTASSRV